MLWARATLPGGRFGEDEVPEQHAALLGLRGVRVECHEVIAEDAFLLVTEPVGLQHLRSALRARDQVRHDRLE